MSEFRPLKAALGLLLTGALLATPAAAAFSDTSGNWAEAAINKWSGEYGLINGYEDGTFHPDSTITRGAFAGIMDRFLHFQTASPADTFSDTAGTYWESAILKLHAAGVYLGTDGEARTTADITRQQAVTMIARAFGLPQSTGTPDYNDTGSLAAYAAGYVAAMSDRGYLTDTAGGYFRPTDAITRAEVVNILNNMIDVLIQDNTPYSADTSGTLMINSPEGAQLENMTVAGNLIIAPGVTGGVELKDVTLMGTVCNLGSAPVEEITTKTTQTPDGSSSSDSSDSSSDSLPELNWTYLTTPDGKKIPNYPNVAVNQMKNSDFVWNGDRLTYVGSDFATRFGIDVSAYQNRNTSGGTIDWNAVKADGVDFVFARIGFRGTSSGTLSSDAFYAKNIDGAMAAGLDTGVYFFSQAITVDEAVEEANYVLKLLDGRKLTGPVAYDWEMHDSTYRVYGTTPEMATACAKAFCDTIRAAGYDAMLYASSYVIYNKFDLSYLLGYPLWYPEYKTASSTMLNPQMYYQMNYWQYTSSGSVAGIGGKVDCDLQFLG